MRSQEQLSPQMISTSDSQLSRALKRLDDWIEKEDFRGWEPHDALNSPTIRSIVGENEMLRLIAVQGLRRSPVNLRKLLRIPKAHNPKAMGLFLASYTYKYRLEAKAEHLVLIGRFARWLEENATKGFSGPCWGYNFDWPNRGFFAPTGTPTVVNTAFVGLSFLEADLDLTPFSERNNNSRTDGLDLLRIARGACDFVLRDLNRDCSTAGQLCFSYTPLDHRFVHNASLLGAQLLAATHARTGEPELREAALSAARFTVARQKSDGSWAYGTRPNDQWVDNFHTGFVLVSLNEIQRLLRTNEFDLAIQNGYQFWKRRMFLENGIPKYYVHRTYPIDVHSIAQAILTFIEFEGSDSEALGDADRLSRWAIKNLQDESGFFHYQIHRWYRNRIPYMRWGQAWMQLALTRLRAVSKLYANQPTREAAYGS